MDIFAPAFAGGPNIQNSVDMAKLKEYIIPFSGLKLGNHRFEYKVDNVFFESFGYEEFNAANIDLEVLLHKTGTMLEFGFRAHGTVNVDCDLTNEPFDLEIGPEMDLLVKFGEAFNDDDDEMLILPHGEYEVDISQYVYEMLVLAVPQKKVHPGVADGSLKSEALEKLKELQPKETKGNDSGNDPRWDGLKKLLTDR